VARESSGVRMQLVEGIDLHELNAGGLVEFDLPILLTSGSMTPSVRGSR